MNSALFNEWSSQQFVRSSPHIAHAPLRALWEQIAEAAYERSRRSGQVPSVLDLGAGDGFSSLPFLKRGAFVTAVDCSVGPRLRIQGLAPRRDCLTILQESVETFLKRNGKRYDIVIASSFLHHVPDYLTLVSEIADVLTASGEVLFFQDPLRYDTQPILTRLFDVFGYAAWRLSQPDAFGGMKRRFRRMRGIYFEDCPQDNVEYHVTRNGVDQDAIAALLGDKGFTVQVIRYWSQQSGLFQSMGAWLRLQNSFGICASRGGVLNCLR